MAHTADWIEPPVIHVSILQLVAPEMILLGLSRLAFTLFCSLGAVFEQCGPDEGADSSAVFMDLATQILWRTEEIPQVAQSHQDTNAHLNSDFHLYVPHEYDWQSGKYPVA